MVKKVNFITFEGPDGSGKSTVSKKVFEKLVSYFKNEKEFILTREPGGTDIAEDIRKIILSKDIDKRTETLLFAASRNEHVKKKIIPAIKNGKIVLCDRFIHSSLVYQGYFRDIGINEVLQVNKFGIGDFLPDLIFYLDVPVETSIKRLKELRENLDRMDFVSDKEIAKINDGYKIVLDLPNVYKINANREIYQIVDEIFSIIVSKV